MPLMQTGMTLFWLKPQSHNSHSRVGSKVSLKLHISLHAKDDKVRERSVNPENKFLFQD